MSQQTSRLRWFGRIAGACSSVAVASLAHGQIVARGQSGRQAVWFEGTVFPEELFWARSPAGFPQGERRIENGWFIQTLRLGDGDPGPTGETDFYVRAADRFVGVDGFFLEWRAVTDNPEWPIYEWKVPTVVTAGGKAGVQYHTVMTESAAAFLRDVLIPRIIPPILVGVPHIYRVEVYPDQYTWYIDGVVADSGVPEGPYPDENARITFGGRREYVDHTTSWDYVRYGRIPDPGTGDFDSTGGGFSEIADYYFVHDCLTKDGPGIFAGPEQNAGPGCRFTDFDFDGDVDLRDFAEFQIIFLGVECEPFCPGPQ